MRILYISQYFPPEVGATQARAYEMAKNWVRLGHQVTMLTEIPNHPSGIIPKAYRGKLYEKTILDGIEVIRLWVKASPEKTFQNRMLFYLTFMLNAILAGIFMARGKYNFLYASSPPLFVGGAAIVISFLKRIPLVFEVRDLWPESAVALGELTNRRAISLATRLENTCYQRARKVVVVTSGIQNWLIQHGVPAEKLIYVPNGANVDLFCFKPDERERIRSNLGISDKFVAIYAGIHGLAQGLESVLEAARLLKSDNRFHFVFIGEGPKKADLVTLAKSYALQNVSMLPEKPREEIPGYLSAADVTLVPLKKAEVFKGVLPSKIFDAWACERPILLSIDGEARSIVESVSGGIFVPPENPEKLVQTLIILLDSPSKLEIMGKNGRIYTVKYHSRVALAEKLISILENHFSS